MFSAVIGCEEIFYNLTSPKVKDQPLLEIYDKKTFLLLKVRGRLLFDHTQ